MITQNITETDNTINTEIVPYELPKAFLPFMDKKIWLASGEDKKPISPLTGQCSGWNEPKNWGTYSALEKHIQDNPNHIPAIIISKESELVALDLDHAIDKEGNVAPWAQNILNLLPDAYVEKGSSGDGFHLFMLGSKPGEKKFKNFEGRQKLEMYGVPDASPKPIRLTGLQCNQCEQLTDLSPIIAEIYKEHWPENSFKEKDYTPYKTSPPLSDEEVIEKCRRAKNNDKFTALFDKDDKPIPEKGLSEFDIALIGILAFYTQNKEQLARLFRKSEKLKRDKWDREDYIPRTIDRVLESLINTWQPSGQSDSSEFKEPTWETPSFIDDNENLEVDFPIDEVAPILRDAAKEAARFIKVDPVACCMPGLGMTALTIGKKVRVIEKPGLYQQPSLFLTVVSKSGERKSACFDVMLDDIKDEITKEEVEYENQKLIVAANNTVIKQQEDDIKALLKQNKISPKEAQDKLLELYKSKQKLPIDPYNFGEDITSERLAQKINEHGGAYGVFSSDARVIFKRILGSSNGDSGEDIYIKGMWGDDISRGRVGNNRGEFGGEETRIRKPALTTVAFIQPDLWEEMSKDKQMKVSGMISRINLAIPTSQMGERIETKEDIPLDKTKIQPFTEAIMRLRRWKPQKQVDVPLSPEAADERMVFFNSIEREIGPGRSLDDVSDIATKATSITARIALNMAVLEAASKETFNGEIPPISKEQWLCAQALEEYFLGQAIDTHRSNSRTGKIHKLQKIVSWLKTQLRKQTNSEKPLVLLPSQIAKGIRGLDTTHVEALIPNLLKHKILRPFGTLNSKTQRYEINRRIVNETN